MTRSTVADRAAQLQTTLAGNNLPTLDGYRAVGIFLVAADHFGFAAPGGMALTGFFALSGFLITWLLRKEQHATGAISIRQFYLRRMLRILPAYYVYVGLSLATVAFLGRPLPYGMVSSSLLYVANYYNAFNGHPPGPFSHLWSLAVEEQFYLLWPLLLVVVSRRGTKAVATFLASAIGFVLIWRTVVYLNSASVAYIYNAFDTRFDCLAVGCLLAVCVESERFRRFVGVVTRWTWLPLVTLAVLWQLKRVPVLYQYTAGYTVHAILLSIFIVQLVTLYKSRLWSWLEHPAVRYVGGISYPMYLYHQWGIGVGYKAAFLPPLGQYAIGMAATVAVGALSYHFVERPFLRLKKRFESYRNRTAARPQIRPALIAPELAVQTAGHRTGIHLEDTSMRTISPKLDHIQEAHAMELRRGERFPFGANWDRFLGALDDERIAEAERSLRTMLETDDLRGRRFLDVGSGSGLFSLAARRLGARVHSFDYDPASVQCTAALKRRWYPDDANWTVEQGSVLDRGYIESLGTHDVVYAWGVLHHTGAMWQALENLVPTLAPKGRLFLAIYNDQGQWSKRWHRVKRLYCSGPVGRAVVCATFIPAFALRNLASDVVWMRNPVRRYSEYKRNRGMSVVHDWIDWLGGYPFEVAKPEHIFEFFRERGLDLQKLKTCGGTVGCNEFVFEPGNATAHKRTTRAVAG